MAVTLTVGEKSRLSPHSSGFDYLRIGLSVAVVCWHCFPISYGPAAEAAIAASPFGVVVRAVIPMFFALSGFLVAGSLDRNTLPAFLSLRAIRIFPALTVEVLLSAFILGPLLTTAPLKEYFTAHAFFDYLGNVVGRIRYILPGVFDSNPFPQIVNGQLWTVPYELECYLALSVLALFKKRFRFLLLFATLCAIVVMTGREFIEAKTHLAEPNFNGRALTVAFLCGVCLYDWKERIVYSAALALCCALAFVLLAHDLRFQFLCAIPAAYVTVWFGLQDVPKRGVLKGGDYSYGLYLFAFPIQQTVATVAMFRHWYVNLAIVLAAGFTYAAFSWHLVERPILQHKRRVVDTVDSLCAGLLAYLPAKSKTELS